MEPGQCSVFNNRRIFHGRREFELTSKEVLHSFSVFLFLVCIVSIRYRYVRILYYSASHRFIESSFTDRTHAYPQHPRYPPLPCTTPSIERFYQLMSQDVRHFQGTYVSMDEFTNKLRTLYRQHVNDDLADDTSVATMLGNSTRVF